MRVLQINSVCGVGSTGRIATDLYKVLEEQGHECLIAYGRGTAPEGINSYKIGTNLDNYLHVARTRLLDQHGYGSKKPTIELVKKIKEYNPDIIHLHNLHGYYLNLEILFNYLVESSKLVVWTLHDCWAFTGHCAYFDYVQCEKWKTGCKNCIQKKKYPNSYFKDNSFHNYELKKEIFTGKNNMIIITPSQWLAKQVKESFLNKYPIRVINNGIDLKVFTPKVSDFRKRYNLEQKKVIVGIANVWDERKGLIYFIRMANALSEDFQIIIVGVNRQQKKLLPNNIIAIEQTNCLDELIDIYNAADIFINPTLEDNFPTTNLESLACGTPVITFNTGGSSESINSECGFIVDKKDIDNLLKVVRNISVKDKKIISNCIKQSRKYDKYKKINEIISLYKEFI